jgi:hypothetical protein
MRLTWPQGDHSRALVGLPQAEQANDLARETSNQWVNVVPTDIRLHLVTSSFVGKGKDTPQRTRRRVTNFRTGRNLARNQLAFPSLPELIPTWCEDVADDEKELLRFCKQPRAI